MRSKIASGIIVLFILSLVVSVNMSQETSFYSIKIGNQMMEFFPSPELGYVMKSSGNKSAFQLLNDTMPGIRDEDKRHFNISNRDDMVVIFDKDSPAQNKNNISLLKAKSEISYIAPLFVLQGQTVVVMPEILVRLERSDDYDALNDLCAKLNCSISHKLLYTEKEYCINSAARNAKDVFDVVEIFNLADFIEWATPSIAFQISKFSEPISEYKGVVEPNDTYFNKQWHLDMIRAPEAWGYTTGDPNIIVAVIDDGVQTNHPDLINNIWTNPGEIPDNGIDDDGNSRIDDIHGWNFYHNTNDVEPRNSGDGHGTACAGLIAAQGNNNLGVIGVAWNCTIMPVKISYAGVFTTDASIASAIRYAAISHADIISNSWGGVIDVPVLHSAIKDVTKINGIGREGKGCVVLFSSGNWADGGEIVYPAKYPEVISIGAVDPNYIVWHYSGSGPELDFVAPSGDAGSNGNMWTTDIGGTQGYNNRDSEIQDYTDKMGGTSGACPVAAGVAALVLSVDPNLTCSEVKSIMADSSLDLGTSGLDESYGYGCLDAYEAISLALNPREITIYVDANAPSDPGPDNPDISDSLEDGSEEHPFDSIQEAINYSMYKDVIIVLPGIYTGHGNRDIDFSGKVITIRSQDGAGSCIIDCQSKYRAFYFHNQEGVNSVIDGFTIRNGNAPNGGGIYIYNSNPAILNCIISANTAGNGGGLAISNGGALIKDCNFVGNDSESRGGGLYGKDFSLILLNSTFRDNESSIGGGLYSNQGNNIIFSNCNFIENNSRNKGGGLYTSDIIDINECVFTGNISNGDGGGIYFNEGSDSILNNSTFTENRASRGGGMFNYKCDQILNSCTFIRNSTYFEGGGVYIDISDNSVLNTCEFVENHANKGGGIYNSSSDTQLLNCVFNENTSDKGGGLYTYSAQPTVKGCIFNGNSASIYGGGIFTAVFKLKITNCILTNNIADSGGGLYGESYSYDVINCTFYGNKGGIAQGSGSCRINSCILWNNEQDLSGYVYTTSCWVQTTWIDPKFGPRTPNSGDPLFADPGNGDFHLKSQAGRWNPNTQSWIKDNVTSPCIDAGDESKDTEDEIWPHGGRINIGAYGGTVQASKSYSE